MGLPPGLADRLAMPLIAAPMTGVSGPDLVIESCRRGVIGSFPTHNADSVRELDRWMTRIRAATGAADAPVAANLVVHRSNERLPEDLACLTAHGIELVISSVGSPAPVIEPLHAAGCLVFADVATMRHVDRAIGTGVDGLVLLTAGAGGQTGWNNPFSFVRAVRDRYDGPVVLAGGIGDGAALFAARALGADLAYMGTKFIATHESLASPAYREALVAATLDEVTTTTARTGLPANILSAWLEANAQDGAGRTAFNHSVLTGGQEAWAAGHSVHGVDRVLSVAELIERTRIEYEHARTEGNAP